MELPTKPIITTKPGEREVLQRELSRLANVGAIRGELAQQILAIVQPAMVENDTQPIDPRLIPIEDDSKEVETRKMLSLTQAREYLLPYGIDLFAEKDNEVKRAIRWGLTTKDKSQEYSAKFDEMQIPEEDLDELVGQIDDDPNVKQMVFFNVDNMTDEEAYTILIHDALIPYSECIKIGDIAKVHSETGRPLIKKPPSGKTGVFFLPESLFTPGNHIVELIIKNLSLKGSLLIIRRFFDCLLPKLYPNITADLDNLDPNHYKMLLFRVSFDWGKSALKERLPDIILADYVDANSGETPGMEVISPNESGITFQKDDPYGSAEEIIAALEISSGNRYEGDSTDEKIAEIREDDPSNYFNIEGVGLLVFHVDYVDEEYRDTSYSNHIRIIGTCY